MFSFLSSAILNDKCGQDWEYDGASSVYDGRCYRFAVSDYSRWSDAVHQCRTEGGDLASISGYDEQNFLFSEYMVSPINS